VVILIKESPEPPSIRKAKITIPFSYLFELFISSFSSVASAIPFGGGGRGMYQDRTTNNKGLLKMPHPAKRLGGGSQKYRNPLFA